MRRGVEEKEELYFCSPDSFRPTRHDTTTKNNVNCTSYTLQHPHRLNARHPDAILTTKIAERSITLNKNMREIKLSKMQ